MEIDITKFSADYLINEYKEVLYPINIDANKTST